MDQLDTRQLLQSVTRMVEKPDVRALELSLVATLSKIIKSLSIRLCQLQRDPENPEQRVLICSETQKRMPLESTPGFQECLQSERKVVVIEKDHVLAIHPIMVRSGMVGFLAIASEKEDEHDQEIVSILLDFYKNYASLLYDNERDTLTGFLNRNSFYEKVLQLIGFQRGGARIADANGGSCIAVIDIDNFKSVNDEYGQLVGDETLILFARAMAESFRGADLLFRVGEEFVVVLKDVNQARAAMVLDRLRHSIEARDFPQLGRLTVSIGASLVTAGDLPMNIVDRAKKALAYAKSNGRNQVRFYEDLAGEGKVSVTQRPMHVEFFVNP
jgi:diguanylate cyclase (GGDEF)-like protein